MDMFVEWSCTDWNYAHVLRDARMTIFVYTLHGRRYPILVVGKNVVVKEWFGYKAPTWTHLIEDVIGLDVQFPYNLISRRCAERWLQEILSGSPTLLWRLNLVVAKSIALQSNTLFFHIISGTSSASKNMDDLLRDENRGSPSKTISFNVCCTLVRSGGFCSLSGSDAKA
nr:hypothetical protein Iba_chr09eCG12020 [Ipomoea batatas]